MLQSNEESVFCCCVHSIHDADNGQQVGFFQMLCPFNDILNENRVFRRFIKETADGYAKVPTNVWQFCQRW